MSRDLMRERERWQRRKHLRARYANLTPERKIAARAAGREYIRKNPQAQCAHSCAMRARKSGIPWDFRYLRTMPCPVVCPVLGTPIRFAYGEGPRPAANTASFDRIDPAKGYVPGNVQIISLLANQMKSDASPAQLVAFANWILGVDALKVVQPPVKRTSASP